MEPDDIDAVTVTAATAESLATELRARAAAATDRLIVGICGAPGAGKSTLAHGIAKLLGPETAVVVPFDGFHLATDVIRGTPLQDRRGALDTFDLGSYRALLERLRSRDEDVVYAPSFRREIEEPIASSIPIPRETPLVITEGNYLLVDHPDLALTRLLLDAVWYLDTPHDVRLPRLIARHARFGRSAADASAWANGTDATNAELVRSTRHRADLVIRLQDSAPA